MIDWPVMAWRGLLGALLAFIAVALLLEGLYGLWLTWRGAEARRLARRLLPARYLARPILPSLLRPAEDTGERAGAGGVFRWWIARGRNRLGSLQQQAGWRADPARLLLGSAVLALVAGVTAQMLLRADWRGILVVAACASVLPWGMLLWQRARRLRHLERQLPDALDFIARAMRAGHAFQVGLRLAGEELAAPIGPELAFTHEEVNFGVPLPEALDHLARRMPSADLRFFVVAVILHRESGGNLTALMSNLSALIRARLKLGATIRALTAEGRMSAWILAVLPFVLTGVLAWANPEFINVLWRDPVGIRLTQIMLGLMAIGALWLWHITRVRI